MTFRTLALGLALFATPVFADAGSPFDAGDLTPDASAGMGGAEMMTQEGDETRPNGVCSLSRDCERGFACVNGSCRYVGYRQAELGCNAAPGMALLVGAVALLLARRRRCADHQQRRCRVPQPGARGAHLQA